jgi:electron transfer flavoprotein beta subunit
MNILVCVKQVPDTMEIKFDEEKHTLMREGVSVAVNPFDSNALELAVRLKEKYGGMVVVVSMGPMQAESALRECLSVGADRAYLVSDRSFGGSDTLATSYVLSSAIQVIAGKEGIGVFDLVLCGCKSTDSDTAQVGPQIAEWLSIPQATNVSGIEDDDDGIVVEYAMDGRNVQMRMNTPCLATIGKIEGLPRYSNMMSKLAAMRAQIAVMSSADIPEIDLSMVGLAGSPTKMVEMYAPQRERTCAMYEGNSEEVFSVIVKKLEQLHVLN